MDYRCRACGKVFNLFTATPLQSVRFSPARLVMIPRGFCQGVTTLYVSQELNVGRRNLLKLRHRVQGMALEPFPPAHCSTASSRPTRCMHQNAGEKGRRHPDPADPPRRRGHHFNGHDTCDNDRPPIIGVISRDSGQVFLRQTRRSTANAIELVVVRVTAPRTAVHTDEWYAYDDLDDRGRTHSSVKHKEWARDDGDGVHEVQSHTLEGFWLGLRNYLRPFPGVSKWCLDLYLACCQGIHNFRRDFLGFVARLLRPITLKGT